MQTVAVGTLLTVNTGRATWTALATVGAFLPMSLLSPIGGVLADRVDRRRWLIVGNALNAVVALGLAALSAAGRASPGAMIALVFLGGSLVALMHPCQSALLPDIVAREDLLAASSLGMVQYNLGRMFGPGVAAAVIRVASFTWAFALNALSYAAAVLALVLIRPRSRSSKRESESVRKSLRDGYRFARGDQACMLAILVHMVVAFFIAPYIALLPAKAALLSGGGATATAGVTAALTTAQGLGAVVGALLVASLAQRFGRNVVIGFNLAILLLVLCVYAAAGGIVATVAAVALAGSLYIGVLSGLSTIVQLRAPDQFRGRVLGLHFMSFNLMYPLGSLVQGALADQVGLGVVTLLGVAVASFLLIIVLVRVWKVNSAPNMLIGAESSE